MDLKSKETRIIVCVGSGGVGKTTMSASIAMAAAQAGRKVLVLTVDPSRRLADALGVDPTKGQSTVSSFNRGSLTAEIINSEEVFADFVKNVAPTPEAAQGLLNNRLFKELMGNLSESQDFTSLEKLVSVSEKKEFDLIVLDTPPSQNAMMFLRSPERIFSLFQESVTKWFTAKNEGGFWQQLFKQGTKTAFAALEKITGSAFLRELSDFFTLAGVLQKEVAERSRRAHRLLVHEQTKFVLVTAFDEAKLKEALEFAQDFQRLGHHLETVVINRARPQWLNPLPEKKDWGTTQPWLSELIELQRRLYQYYYEREKNYDRMLERLHKSVRIWRIPEAKEGVYGLAALEWVVKQMTEGEK